MAVVAVCAAAGAARAEPGDGSVLGDPRPVRIHVTAPGDRSMPATGLFAEVWGAPVWFTGASHTDPRWSLAGGAALGGVFGHDTLVAGDHWFAAARAGYGTVDVDIDEAVRQDFVIIAGNEPYLLSGANRLVGTERLGMVQLTGDVGWQVPLGRRLHGFVSLGIGLVELFGDRGKTSFAARAAAGLEAELAPRLGFVLEISDLVFRAPVLAGHPVHAVSASIGLRFRF